jgi:LacI family transcriptional regulator
MLRDEQVDAVFAANNRASMGTLMAFRELGRRVPLVGFDDFEAATMVDPAVSVVRQNIAAVSQASVDLLLRRQAGWDGPAETITIATELELRGSERP